MSVAIIVVKQSWGKASAEKDAPEEAAPAVAAAVSTCTIGPISAVNAAFLPSICTSFAWRAVPQLRKARSESPTPSGRSTAGGKPD